jgi:hypothetical protein
MATTTNYGWTTPDDTSLVKDGAAAIRTLGSSVDTTTKALNPSTTLGDIEYRSATANTNTRLGIGTSAQVLTVSGGVPAWVTPTSGSMTQIATGTLSGVEVSLTSISGSYRSLYLVITGARINTGTTGLGIRINNVTAATYNFISMITQTGALNNNASLTSINTTSNMVQLNTTATDQQQVIRIENYAQAGVFKAINWQNGDASNSCLGIGFANTSAAVTSIQMRTVNGTATFNNGTYTLFGVN